VAQIQSSDSSRPNFILHTWIAQSRTAGVRPARTPVVVEERTMKFSLRVTLLSIMLLLVGFTVAGLGFNSYWNASSVADDLSKQIL